MGPYDFHTTLFPKARFRTNDGLPPSVYHSLDGFTSLCSSPHRFNLASIPPSPPQATKSQRTSLSLSLHLQNRRLHTSRIPYPPRIHPHINPNQFALHCSLSSVSIHRRFIIPSPPSSFLSKILLASCSPRRSPGCIYRFVLHRISPTSHFSHPTTPSLTSSHFIPSIHLTSISKASLSSSPLTSSSSLHTNHADTHINHLAQS